MRLDFAAIGLRFFVGSIFLLAGLAKLPRRSEFDRVVRSYGVLPGRLVSPAARTLPVLEIAVGALLLLGLGTRTVGALGAAALVGFSAAVGINLARGNDLDCGCFAVGAPRRITWSLIIRNAALVAMAIVVAGWAPAVFALDSLLAGGGAIGVTSGDAVGLMLAATLSVVALTLAAEIVRLLSLARRMDRVMV
jgi:uncharacterized membrane protein YphA (DoxX/SURF4 family)